MVLGAQRINAQLERDLVERSLQVAALQAAAQASVAPSVGGRDTI
jgi:hypothetical protein